MATVINEVLTNFLLRHGGKEWVNTVVAQKAEPSSSGLEVVLNAQALLKCWMPRTLLIEAFDLPCAWTSLVNYFGKIAMHCVPHPHFSGRRLRLGVHLPAFPLEHCQEEVQTQPLKESRGLWMEGDDALPQVDQDPCVPSNSPVESCGAPNPPQI